MKGLKLTLILAAMGQAMFAKVPAPRRLDVCMGLGTNLLPFWQAKKLTSVMLLTAGVEITWHIAGRHCPPEAIEIKVIEAPPAARKQNTLAHTWPYEGTRIEVFYSRIRGLAGPQLTAQLLAHVMTHEIGHVLQHVSRHSATGIMKANFDQRDIQTMAFHPLEFTPLDIDLIHDGFDSSKSPLLFAEQDRRIDMQGAPDWPCDRQ